MPLFIWFDHSLCGRAEICQMFLLVKSILKLSDYINRYISSYVNSNYFSSPHQPKLKDVIMPSTLYNFVTSIKRNIIVFVLLEKVIRRHFVTFNEYTLEEKEKRHIFWEGHKILRNLHLTFVLCSASQK